MVIVNLLHNIRKRLPLCFTLAVATLLTTFCNQLAAQALTITPPEFAFENITHRASALDVHDSEVSFTPYSTEQYQPMLARGLQFQEAGEHEAALDLLNRAWQINRINNGLFHESQIPVLKSIVYSELETRDWEAVDRFFDYMTHLYQQLYDIDDPRLEAGLQQVSSFHITAFNADLDGEREYHLRKATELLELRLEGAELTLADDDPKLLYLQESIALSRKNLYLMSERYKEMLVHQGNENRDRLFADLD